jgi:N utilization substance protein A
MVVNELRGEKVDIVPFSDDPPEFVMKALSPARVSQVRIDEESGTALVIVPDYQLSLAIGKEGQNARLAARLTGWRVDIMSETQHAEAEAGYAGEEWAQGEWITDDSGNMVWRPAEGGDSLSADEWSEPPADASAGDGVPPPPPPPPADAPAPSEPVEAADAAVAAVEPQVSAEPISAEPVSAEAGGGDERGEAEA